MGCAGIQEGFEIVVDLFSNQQLVHLITTYSYWAVLLLVGIESMGVPLPGETALLVASVYAGATHRLDIALVIGAAGLGAVLGDNLGYLIGRLFGYRLLHRYGRYVRLDERRLQLGRYLFDRHGGKVVFLGRFVSVLRMWAAFLAGANRMDWKRFFISNLGGSAVWAVVMGVLGYVFGNTVVQMSGLISIVSMVLATLLLGAILILLRRHEDRLAAEAERAGYEKVA